MELYNLKEGASPLVFSSPHAGTFVPDDIKAQMTDAALSLPDTDWHIPELYDFIGDFDTTVICANYSRYVIDLNRPPDNEALYPGQTKVSLCPDETFDGAKIYKSGNGPDEDDVIHRLAQYWTPYHEELERQIYRVKKLHGFAILYDAHSIKGNLGRLFDGRLPDLNLGTAGGKSCAPDMGEAAFKAVQDSDFTSVLNGRFIGGYITRYHGKPENHVHAIQMELVRENYMDEDSFEYVESRADKLRPVLKDVIKALADWANEAYAPLAPQMHKG